jgi:hypothetical protein
MRRDKSTWVNVVTLLEDTGARTTQRAVVECGCEIAVPRGGTGYYHACKKSGAVRARRLAGGATHSRANDARLDAEYTDEKFRSDADKVSEREAEPLAALAALGALAPSF